MVIDHTDPFAPPSKPDPALIKAIVKAHRFNETLVLSRCVLEFAGAVSGGMRIRGQAAKSIGCSARFWFRVCHPSTLRIAI
jgi:hypothetical protein